MRNSVAGGRARRKMRLMGAKFLRLSCVALLAAFLPAGAWAQNALDHVELYFGEPIAFGQHVNAQTIPGSQVTLAYAGTTNSRFGAAFRLTRLSAGSLWLEFPFTSVTTNQHTPVSPGIVSMDAETVVPGLRYMIGVLRHPLPSARFPLYNGAYLYGTAGAGLGFMDYPVVVGGPPQQVFVNPTTHGAFDMAGGIEVRVFNSGVRFDFRDMVTGRGLNGVAGRNHPVLSLELVIHL